MLVVGGILALFGALVFVARFLHRDAFVLPFFLFVPALAIAMRDSIDATAFTWIKIFTLAISMFIISAIPRIPEVRRSPARWALAGILALNILEAVLWDLIGGRWWNAAVGLALIATQPGPSAIEVAREPARVRYQIPATWIAAYTAWNFAFVSAQYPLHWTDHFAVLSAPIVVALWRRDASAWLAARALTLAVYAFVITLAIELFRWPWLPSIPPPPWVRASIAASAALLCVIHVARRRRNLDDARQSRSDAGDA